MDFLEVGPCTRQAKAEGKMSVPVRAYGNDAIFDKMCSDRTLQQAASVATLPGVLDAVMVMPDGHEGYGFPIGGVAAFDLENGVVSPGGVGYDINCLCKGSKILDCFGRKIPIESIEGKFTKMEDAGAYILGVQKSALLSVASLDSGSKSFSSSRVLAFMKKKADNRILEVTTASGQKITLSEDHPLLTPTGMVPAGSIREGGLVAVSYFEGVDYVPFMPSLGMSEDAAAVMAKVLGYMFGDGTLTVCGKKPRAIAFGEKADLERMQADLASIGVKSSVFERSRNHRIVTQYGEREFSSTTAELHVYSKEFCSLLSRLGMPLGRKTDQDYAVPQWVMDKTAPSWVKRLFLAGFFGAELSSPSVHSKTGFYAPILGQNKNKTHAASGRAFLIQLMQLLDETANVNVTKIARRDEFRNKQGDTVRLRLEISADEENLLQLYRRVGFEYSSKKSVLAGIAAKYIIRKKALTALRTQAAQKAKELRAKGLTLNEVQSLLCNESVNARFIRRHYYEKAGQRITLGFPSFEKFAKDELEVVSAYGTQFDSIASIREVPYDDDVYDITVANTHNFIADGFVVSNCGIRLIRTNLTEKDVKPKINALIQALFANIPSGVGSKSKTRLDTAELGKAVTEGVDWCIGKGYAVESDKEHCEENGRFEGADFSKVSDMAKKRGAPQFGTLGSGNHFLEVQKVEKVYDAEKAKAFGITGEGQITVMIHSGSRGLGHQVCDDYLRTMLPAAKAKYGLDLADRELCCAPIQSPEAQDYLGAMKCAVNFAFNNRQVMTHQARQTFAQVFGGKWEDYDMGLVYDVCHNIAKFEEYEVDGQRRKVCVHRKGATRALWAGNPLIPQAYRSVGQPVIIPGSMNSASFLLCGAEGSKKTFGSSCHGAGRIMSRSQAKRDFSSAKILAEMEKAGVSIKVAESELVSEEYGGAYKDIDAVVDSVQQAGISTIVAKMVPLGVIKG